MDSNLTVTLGTPQPRGRVRTELTASAELEVRIHSPPAVSPVRTTGSRATFAMGRVARREMILRSKRYPRVDRVVCSMALDTD